MCSAAQHPDAPGICAHDDACCKLAEASAYVPQVGSTRRSAHAPSQSSERPLTRHSRSPHGRRVSTRSHFSPSSESPAGCAPGGGHPREANSVQGIVGGAAIHFRCIPDSISARVHSSECLLTQRSAACIESLNACSPRYPHAASTPPTSAALGHRTRTGGRAH